ncbi:hypothetical protein KDN24_06160 [Bacillus sp. Bva_UNVM-123]|uniref:hypothetical protein n=1 Tax=Bacillus sp. Bva_UNVM-123 TaxID=2829798 RepID=UPI00391F5FE7
MTSFNNLKDLQRFVNRMAKESMVRGNAVKSEVIETGKKHVQEDVYDVYTTRVYQRSGQLKENWEVEETVDGIAVFSNRVDEGRNVSEIVETGQGYQFDFEFNGKPRPFTENTRKELAEGARLKDALKKDMKSIGLDVT